MRNTAIAIIFNAGKDQVLLVKRRDIPIWVLPGGGIDPLETPAEAVIREVNEETGLQVVIQRQVGEYAPINRITRFTHTFECLVIGGTISHNDEAKAVAFYPLQDLPATFFFLHGEWLKDALQCSPQIIKKEITSITYKKIFILFLAHPLIMLRAVLARLGLPFNS